MAYSIFSEEDYKVIDAAWQDLRKEAVHRCTGPREMETVERAFQFANLAHRNVRRRSGEPYILHPIAVAKIVVSEIGLGYKSICAALLHDVVEDTDHSIKDIEDSFGKKIASFVEGLTKIKNVLKEERENIGGYIPESIQAENLKRILVTLNDDVRVVLIKMADRLHNCRTIEFMPEHKRDKILSETMFLFIPLAHRLGLYAIKTEMENIWLKFKEPDAYREITRKISDTVKGKDKELKGFLEPIKEALTDAGVTFTLKTRIKTPYSVWRKMHTKNIPFDQVYDLFAVRIVFTNDSRSIKSEREECYRIFSIITSIYGFMPNRVRDWVSRPKSNNYEALHCTLLSAEGTWIEVQIRSNRMDDIAEKGIAAHWSYKQEGYSSEDDSEIDKWLTRVRDILANPDISALDMLDTFHSDLAQGEISVITPKGERKTILKGATALDFAYLIHTHIGNKAAAAKVNFRLVPLSTVLNGGDQVEIITDENVVPQRDWLQFVRTRKARTKILDWFKSRRESESGGRLGSLTQPLGSHQEKGGSSLLRRLHNQITRRSQVPKDVPKVHIEGNFIIATCCNPIPSDAVVGIKTPDGNITIHKKTCTVAENIGAKHGDWIVEPDWESITGESSFPVTITIRGLDRIGLLNEITKYLTLIMACNIRKLYMSTGEGLFDGYIELSVRDREQIDTIIRRLRSIDGVQSVNRQEN